MPVKILYNTRRPIIICPHLCGESILCMLTSVLFLTPDSLSSPQKKRQEFPPHLFLYVIQEVGNMGNVFTDFTFLNTPTYISVVILSFFLLRLSLSSPHEPRALPEVNRLALGGTVSPRETPSPSCPHFCSVECGHTHMSRYGPLHCLPFIFPGSI